MDLAEIPVSDEFEARTMGRKRLIVRSDGADSIAQALATGENCSPVARSERGALRKFFWIGNREGLVRVCHRGGLLGPLLGGKYLIVNRPGREFRCHFFAEQRGVRVPHLLGVCWERKGPWITGAIATELLPGTDLLAWLRQHDSLEDRPRRAGMMQSVGELVRDMHWRGVWHADLQVKNIIVFEDSLWLIDLDRAVIGQLPSVVQCGRNLLRFRRSLQKNGLPEVCYERFAAGYGAVNGEAIPAWLDKLYLLKGRFSPSTRRNKA